MKILRLTTAWKGAVLRKLLVGIYKSAATPQSKAA